MNSYSMCLIIANMWIVATFLAQDRGLAGVSAVIAIAWLIGAVVSRK